MATWLRSGSVDVTNGASTINFTGVDIIASGVRTGDAFHAPDGKVYEINKINTATQAALAQNYLGATAATQAYAIQPTRGVIKQLTDEVRTLISQVEAQVDGILSGRFPDGTVGAPSFTNTGDTDTGLFFPADDTLAAVTGGVERWRLSNAGNFGVGITAPATKAHIKGDALRIEEVVGTRALDIISAIAGTDHRFVGIGTGSGFIFENNVGALLHIVPNAYGTGMPTITATGSSSSYPDRGGVYRTSSQDGLTIANFGTIGTTAFIGTQTSHPLVFLTGGSERARVDISGNFGVGLTAPDAKLHVTGVHNGAITRFTTGTNYQGIEFGGATLTGYSGVFTIKPDTVPGTGTTYALTHFQNHTTSVASTVQNVAIDGRLGIGSTNPLAPLHIATGTNNQIRIQGIGTDASSGYVAGYAANDTRKWWAGNPDRTSTHVYLVNDDSAGQLILQAKSGVLAFYTGTTEKGRFDANGNLMIGTTNTGVSLYGATTAISGAEINNQHYLNICRDGIALTINRPTTTGSVANWYQAGTIVGSISVSATATSYNTSSARWLKDNITDYEQDSGAMIDALKPRSFDWKVTGKRELGFIADEFGEVFPTSTTYDEDGRAAAIDAGTPEVVATLVAQAQSLRKRVAHLESVVTQIYALDARVAQLEAA